MKNEVHYVEEEGKVKIKTNFLEQEKEKLTSIYGTEQTVYSTLYDMNLYSTNRINYIDNFIDEAGYTRYHFHIFFINAVVFFMIGSEFVITNLLLSTLKKEWNLTDQNLIFISSALFIGILQTSILSGNINSKYGRKTPTIVGCFILCIFSASTAFINNFWVMFIVKIIVGFGIGIIIPSFTSLITELIPNTNRSLVLNSIWGLYPLGMIYVCYIGIHFIKRNIFDWRTTCLINSFSGIPILYLVLFLDESPRYLFLKVTSGNKNPEEKMVSDITEENEFIEQGFKILNKLGKSVGKILTNEDKKNILNQLREDRMRNNIAYERSVQNTIEKRKSKDLSETGLNKSIRNKTTNKFSFSLFFTEENKFISINLLFLWFLTSLISFGLLVVLPKHYELILKNDKSESMKNMILTMYVSFPCPFIRGAISEIKGLGRRFTMVIGFSGAAFFSFLSFISESNLFIYTGLLNFFINISLGVVSVYTSEYYDTLLRSGALGMGNAFTRIGGITAPFLVNFADKIIYKGAFFAFTLLSIIGAIFSFLLKESKDLKIR
jgi:MFS family permease